MNDDLRLIMRDQTQQLEKLLGDWATAELRGDTAFLERNLADDFVGVGPYGFLFTKDEWLERHESRKLRYESFRLDEVRVCLYGEVAVIRVSEIPLSTLTSADLGTLRFQIVAAVSVALLLLITATTLSVYKPWGRTWFG